MKTEKVKLLCGASIAVGAATVFAGIRSNISAKAVENDLRIMREKLKLDDSEIIKTHKRLTSSLKEESLRAITIGTGAILGGGLAMKGGNVDTFGAGAVSVISGASLLQITRLNKEVLRNLDREIEILGEMSEKDKNATVPPNFEEVNTNISPFAEFYEDEKEQPAAYFGKKVDSETGKKEFEATVEGETPEPV